MKVTKQVATALKCLGGKLEIVASDPDPKAYTELTKEYNCPNCDNFDICVQIRNQAPLS